MTPAIWVALIELIAALAKNVVEIILHARLSPEEKQDEIAKLTQKLRDVKRRVGEVEI